MNDSVKELRNEEALLHLRQKLLAGDDSSSSKKLESISIAIVSHRVTIYTSEEFGHFICSSKFRPEIRAQGDRIFLTKDPIGPGNSRRLGSVFKKKHCNEIAFAFERNKRDNLNKALGDLTCSKSQVDLKWIHSDTWEIIFSADQLKEKFPHRGSKGGVPGRKLKGSIEGDEEGAGTQIADQVPQRKLKAVDRIERPLESVFWGDEAIKLKRLIEEVNNHKQNMGESLILYIGEGGLLKVSVDLI